MSESRKAALNRQVFQLIDALLVLLAFQAAGNVLGVKIAGQSWVLYLVVPFTPLILEAVGYYRLPRRASRLLGGLLLMASGLAAAVERPAWLVTGIIFTFVLLRGRDAFVARYVESRGEPGPP